MRKKIAELLVLLIACAAVVSAGARETRIQLKLKPELDLDGTESVFVGPILIEPRQGEDIQSGDKVLSAGTVLRSLEIANLISVGITHVKTARPVRVAARPVPVPTRADEPAAAGHFAA